VQPPSGALKGIATSIPDVSFAYSIGYDDIQKGSRLLYPASSRGLVPPIGIGPYAGDVKRWERAMPQRSAGLLMYRRAAEGPEVLLVHPGGPFWARKDEGAWSIPKGLLDDGEAPLAAAIREFAEETGLVPAGPYTPLGAFRQPGGKLVLAWAVEGDVDLAALRSNEFSMEWPPRSGRMRQFPEVDRAGWFGPSEATRKILKGQRAIIATLLTTLGSPDTLLS
jgi:predicted NUDIX family NTP pyrophosphohydrolase